ncbi:MAG TPA: PIN domain-containing protein [Alphaproteobacteria bacterium]
MIAVDTSTLIAYLADDAGRDVDALDLALAQREVCLPPAVVTEILSAPGDSEGLARLILALPALEISDGFWERAGRVRRELRARKLRAPLADALICQSCLDHGVPLLTRDGDFQAFATHCGLQLA